MLRRVSIFCIALVAFGTVLWASAARAGDLPLKAFYGHYVGSGFTFGDFAYYELTKRDLDLKIGPEKDGFFVSWTSVFRPAGAKKERRKSARISFAPKGHRGFYFERNAASRIGKGLTWAEIKGPMLTVRVLAIQNDGSYAVQTYQRIIFEKGMLLHYTSDRDGKTVRMVSAKLTKVK